MISLRLLLLFIIVLSSVVFLQTEGVLKHSMNSYLYPHASIQSQTDSFLILKSADAPAGIIAWYEQNLRNKGLQTKTSVKTNTNGNVDALLIGSGYTKVKILITKKHTATSAIITARHY